MSQAADIADWAASSDVIDGVLFGPSDGREEGPPVCAVAVARGWRGFGKGITQTAALASAVGEALEQYAASQVQRDQLRRAAFWEIEGQAFDPRWLGLYSIDQYGRTGFPYRPFDPERPLHWTLGKWQDNGESVYVPAFAVWLTSAFEDEALCQVTSNGLASGTTLSDAAERAVLELRERDAFLSSWIALRPKTRVALDELDFPITGIVEHLRSRGASMEVYLVEEGPQAFVAVSIGLGNGNDWPAVTIGLGAGVEWRDAVNKAILEHGQTGPFLARIWRNRELPIPQSRDDIHTLRDHALYYCDPAHAPEFDLWRIGSGRADAPVRRVEHGIRRKPARVAIVDLTPADLQDSPFRIVRAVARGLEPLWYGNGYERALSDHLRALLNGREPNPAPHPIC